MQFVISHAITSDIVSVVGGPMTSLLASNSYDLDVIDELPFCRMIDVDLGHNWTAHRQVTDETRQARSLLERFFPIDQPTLWLSGGLLGVFELSHFDRQRFGRHRWASIVVSGPEWSPLMRCDILMLEHGFNQVIPSIDLDQCLQLPRLVTINTACNISCSKPCTMIVESEFNLGCTIRGPHVITLSFKVMRYTSFYVLDLARFPEARAVFLQSDLTIKTIRIKTGISWAPPAIALPTIGEILFDGPEVPVVCALRIEEPKKE